MRTSQNKIWILWVRLRTINLKINIIQGEMSTMLLCLQRLSKFASTTKVWKQTKTLVVTLMKNVQQNETMPAKCTSLQKDRKKLILQIKHNNLSLWRDRNKLRLIKDLKNPSQNQKNMHVTLEFVEKNVRLKNVSHSTSYVNIRQMPNATCAKCHSNSKPILN